MHPAALAYPVDAADVAAALDYAPRNGWQVAVRCGGHSYEGFMAPGSFSTYPSYMTCRLRVKRPAAAGCRQRAVTDALFAAGRALPAEPVRGGRQHAGRRLRPGLPQRGLGCDNLVEAELVTADGRVLNVRDGELSKSRVLK